MQKESIYDKMTYAEKEVASELKRLGIQWSYEQPVFVWDENKRPRVWAPDFYLLHLSIYLEVCGSQIFDYSYRRKIFDLNGYSVVFLHLFKKGDSWKKYLRFQLYRFNFKRSKVIARLSPELTF
jgi:hypothetical protein